MSKIFFEVEYEGNYENLVSFLQEKVPLTPHSVSSSRFLIELYEEDREDFLFFQNSRLDDSISRITKALEINHEEFQNVLSSAKNQEHIDTIVEGSWTTSSIIEETKISTTTEYSSPIKTTLDHNKDGAYSNKKTKPTTDKYDENKNQKIARILNDTIIPSRKPLSESDPFALIISKEYLAYFSVASSFALFVLCLLN